MAHNFKIVKQQNKEGLHLDLSGDFDGSSASELINLLNTDLENNARVSIDTCKLRKVYPFGREVFSQRCAAFKPQGICIDIVGRKAHQVKPN